MTTLKKGEYTGFSDSCIEDALNNALQKAGEHTHFEIIETRGSLINENKPNYQITITAFFE
ncbi:MAG: dodecin domain-containing protein [Tatlockia sp.]|nr:dodecin domain-containing protein [Tatlockia sp.]